MARKKAKQPPPRLRGYDLASIRVDLDFVKKACERLLSMQGPLASDPVLEAALWMSAAVCYSRCFHSGTRAWLSAADLKGLSATHLKTHEYVLDERNQVLAHVVVPGAAIQSIERVVRGDKILGHQVRLERYAHPEPDRILAVAALADAVGQVVVRALVQIHVPSFVSATHKTPA